MLVYGWINMFTVHHSSIAASFHTITSWQRLSDASECSFLNHWIKLHLSETFEMKEKLDLDEFLQYGKFQSLRLWIFGPILAFLGAFSYAHTIFLLQDPTDWHCEDEGVISCNDELEGIVNYQSSIIPSNREFANIYLNNF